MLELYLTTDLGHVHIIHNSSFHRHCPIEHCNLGSFRKYCSINSEKIAPSAWKVPLSTTHRGPTKRNLISKPILPAPVIWI
jgi:hypothetical protein